MAAHMAGRAGLFVTRIFLNKSVHTSRHVFIRSQILQPKLPQRLSVFHGPRHLSTSIASTEIQKIEQFDIEPTATETLLSSEAPVVDTGLTNVDIQELLSDMKYSLEKQQAVRPWCVEQLLDSLSVSEMLLDDPMWTLLLRSSGRVLMNSPEAERQGLLERTISLMQQKNVSLISEHYNAILQSRLENNAIVSLSRFLAEMADNNVTLDEMSYNLVIKHYCDVGDRESAMRIVDSVEQSISVNELMYTPLISMYMSEENVDGALGIIDRMEKHGVVAGTESFRCLLLGYSSKGDMEGIRQTLNSAANRDVTIDPRTILAVIKTLIASSHAQHVPEMTDILSKILQKDLFIHDSVNMIYQLQLECKTAALQLFEALEAHMANREVISLLDRLLINRDTGYSYALELLKHLQTTSRTFRLHQIESLLKLLPMVNHKDSVEFWSRLLRSCNVKEVSAEVEAWEKPKEEELAHTESKFLGLLATGNFERAVAYAQSNTIGITAMPTSLAKALVKGFIRSGRDSQRTAWILKQCSLMAGIPLVKVNSDVIFSILEDDSTSHEEVEALVKYAWQYGVRVSGEEVRAAIQRARLSESKAFLDSWITDLVVHIPTRAEMLTMDLGRQEELWSRLELMGVESADLEELLLEKYIEGGDDANAEKTRGNLDRAYFKDALKKLQSCGAAAVGHRRDPDEARHYLSVIETFFPDQDTLDFELIVAACQAENGQASEAFKTVEAIKDRPMKKSRKMQRVNEAYFYPFLIDMLTVHDLLQNLDCVADMTKMVDLLWSKGIIDETRAFGFALRQHLKRWKFSVLDTMFQKNVNDPLAERLFKAQSSNSEANDGLVEAQFMLYCSLIEDGHVDFVRKCFVNPNFQPASRLQTEFCLWVFENFEDSERDQLLGLLLDVTGVDIGGLVSDLSQSIPVETLASSLLCKYHNFREPNNPSERKLSRKLAARNDTLIEFLATSEKPLAMNTVKGHTVSLAKGNMFLEFVDFVCALRNKSFTKEMEAVAHSLTKPNWVTYTLKQLIRVGVENENYTQVEALLNKIKAKPAWSRLPFVHVPSLLKLHEEKNDLAKVLEDHMISLCKINHHAGLQVVAFYLKTGRIADATHLLRAHRAVRENLRPNFIVRSLEEHSVWTNEQMLLEILHLPIQSQHKSSLRAVVYDQLIGVACEAGNWEGGSYYYNEAMDEKIDLGTLQVSTLQRLQTLLQENRRPVPWAVSLGQIISSRQRGSSS